MDATKFIVLFLCAVTVLFLFLIEIRSRRNSKALKEGPAAAENSAVNKKSSDLTTR